MALEEWAFHRHERWRDLGTTLLSSVLENIGYRQLTVWWRLEGWWASLRGRKQVWGRDDPYRVQRGGLMRQWLRGVRESSAARQARVLVVVLMVLIPSLVGTVLLVAQAEQRNVRQLTLALGRRTRPTARSC